jgi:hypothetical protein
VELGTIRGHDKRIIKGVQIPRHFGSLWNLSPFIAYGRKAPETIPLIDALRQIRALAKLHPYRHDAHALVCKWMEQLLSKAIEGNTLSEEEVHKHVQGKLEVPPSKE